MLVKTAVLLKAMPTSLEGAPIHQEKMAPLALRRKLEDLNSRLLKFYRSGRFSPDRSGKLAPLTGSLLFGMIGHLDRTESHQMKVKSKLKKVPKVSTLRNKADSLLTPIIKMMYPRCMLCPAETQVAHHFVHKSKSTRLRYELDNLIPLCHKCHQRLHHNESYEAGKIIQIKGLKWFNALEKLKNQVVKADWVWYSIQIQNLQNVKEHPVS